MQVKTIDLYSLGFQCGQSIEMREYLHNIIFFEAIFRVFPLCITKVVFSVFKLLFLCNWISSLHWAQFKKFGTREIFWNLVYDMFREGVPLDSLTPPFRGRIQKGLSIDSHVCVSRPEWKCRWWRNCGIAFETTNVASTKSAANGMKGLLLSLPNSL